jgi:hypothetical protein
VIQLALARSAALVLPARFALPLFGSTPELAAARSLGFSELPLLVSILHAAVPLWKVAPLLLVAFGVPLVPAFH